MMQLSQENREKVLANLKTGKVDSASMSFPNLIDSIILAMKKMGLVEKISNSFRDRRDDNSKIPFGIMIALAITAKMKLKTSLTDVGHAITDAQTLAEFGWNLWDTERDINNGLFSEGVMRNLVKKYDADEFIRSYNNYIKDEVLETLGCAPTIHILDCTKITVNLNNENYEKSEVAKIDGEAMRGYKLGTIRGIFQDSGIMEEVILGGLKTHDMQLCRDMLKSSPHFKAGDILINDRGFISRDMVNYLKTEKGVDTYVPAKSNMTIHRDAVSIAISTGAWQKHPNKKRKTQKIQLVKDLGGMWQSETPEKDVELSACVIFDEKDGEYYTFLTSDTEKTARQIILTYELRPEIEEDYRQIKDFWRLEDFKSTQYNFIAFHIVMTLMGYLYFQIYKATDEGRRFIGKSLPVIIKNFVSDSPKSIIIYVGAYFAVFPFIEFIHIYADLDAITRSFLDPVLVSV